MNHKEPAKNSEIETFDVVVIGGGPAGSTVSSFLAQWGYGVLLLEKDFFPRHHVGESMLPGTVTILRRLGVLTEVDNAGFVKKYGATYSWGSTSEPWTMPFFESGESVVSAYQVDRSKFDQILLDNSRSSGVIVREGCRVIDTIMDGDSISGVVYIDDAGNRHHAHSRICVDASGNNAFLGSRTKSRHYNSALRNIAIYGYFNNCKPITELVPELKPYEAGNIFIVAVDKGWIWYIPLSEARYSVGLVTDGRSSREINATGRTEYLKNALMNNEHMSFLLQDAVLEDDVVRTESDWSYVCEKFYGPGYLLVGDAACFIDPILSSGVSIAMAGGLKAARAINTMFKNPKLTELALEWYDDEYQATAVNYTQLVEHWYHGHPNRDDWFWKARQVTNLDENASIRQAFAYVSGGYAESTDEEVETTPLLAFGGFGPFQVRQMYEQFDRDPREESLRALDGVQTSGHGASPLSQDDLVAGTPHIAEGFLFKRSMSVSGNELVPVTRIMKNSWGIYHNYQTFSPAYLPILQRIDGERTVEDIVNSVVEEHQAGFPSDIDDRGLQLMTRQLRQRFLQMFEELYERRILRFAGVDAPARLVN